MSEARKLIKEMGLIAASDKLQASEDNDCVVRALMHTLGITYAESHHLCETKLNRHPGCGVHTNIYLPRIKQSHGKKINQLGNASVNDNGWKRLTRTKLSKVTILRNWKQKFVKQRKEVQVNYKVKEFIKAHPIGTYFVTVRRHAIAIIDGKIIGNWNDELKINREVISAYRIG